jgi:hypothetical protein
MPARGPHKHAGVGTLMARHLVASAPPEVYARLDRALTWARPKEHATVRDVGGQWGAVRSRWAASAHLRGCGHGARVSESRVAHLNVGRQR